MYQPPLLGPEITLILKFIVVGLLDVEQLPAMRAEGKMTITVLQSEPLHTGTALDVNPDAPRYGLGF